VPATRLYSQHGMGWPAGMAAVLAAISVGAMVLSGRGQQS
jgi:hypothetical protein